MISWFKKVTRDPFSLLTGVALGFLLAFFFPVLKILVGVLFLGALVFGLYLWYVKA